MPRWRRQLVLHCDPWPDLGSKSKLDAKAISSRTDMAMPDYESLDDALRVAKEVIDGDVSPNLGCGLIAAIGEKLNYPSEFQLFQLIAHEQYGHESLGITSASCIPDILKECHAFLAAHGRG